MIYKSVDGGWEMKKAIVFDYISQMNNPFKLILKGYPFSDLITNEILNASLISIRELDNSSFDDLETAKRMVRMQINSFFEPKNIQRVVNTYWNDNVTYGFTRVNPTKENLLKFRQAVDLNIPSVVEIKHSLMNAIDKFEPRRELNSKTEQNKSVQKYTIKALVAIAILVFAYLFALNGRYSHAEKALYFDKWTKQALIFNPDTGCFEEIK